MSDDYSHLVHIADHSELKLYDLIPDVVWVFDLDKHGWWWGNEAAIKFWGLNTLQDLIDKDLSGDTQGARDRTRQTFDLAVKEGLTIDPWTTYPGGKPKTLYMRHRAVTLGPDRHRGIIAYVNEEVNLGETPENLLFVEAMRYTNVYVTSYDLQGKAIVENPAATEAYKYLHRETRRESISDFVIRFADHEEGQRCFEQAIEDKGGRYDHMMRTGHGLRSHTLDIRMTRHPLSGDFLLLVVEYDVTPLHAALAATEEAKERLRHMAHYDALTGLPSQHLFQENAALLMSQAARHQERLAVMFLDLDGFKNVNDNHGHDAGDHVLKVVANRLKQCLRDADTVARMGGDEFVVLVSDTREEKDVRLVAEKILQALQRPITLKSNVDVQIGTSIGVAFYPDHGDNSEDLLKKADHNMYEAKKGGKNRICM
ncbi:MAG: sensor domain-containing diguanylate cyclase [Alphaproteobacteria bacterium]|nr:sensor domain-containing diguanylate cyclase [Alphaproteobacteria bacterium]